jgi:hypothetical protein
LPAAAGVELEEEMQSHIEEAIEHGRDRSEALRAFGSTLHHRKASRDIKLLPKLDRVAADIQFAWRQLNQRRVTSPAAVLSLALAIGATMAVYRLADEALLRTLPVATPNGLFYLATGLFDREGRPDSRDDFDYPTCRRYRDLIADRAERDAGGLTARQPQSGDGRNSGQRDSSPAGGSSSRQLSEISPRKLTATDTREAV